MPFQVPEDLNIDPNIISYINSKSEQKVKYDYSPLDREIQKVSESPIEEIKQQFHAKAQMTKTVKDNKGVETSELIRWSDARVTKEEADQFKKSLVTKDPDFLTFKPGPLAELILIPESLTGDRTPIGTLRLLEALNDELLPSGDTLFSGEKCALWLYTFQTYLLLNGTLSNDQPRLNLWLKSVMGLDPKTEKAQQFLKKCQKEVPRITEMALSALHKLASHEGKLYRGSAMRVEKLEEWRNGKFMMTEKIFSCSTAEDIAELWAKSIASEYMQDTHQAYKPVLYVINAKNAKSIIDYSLSPDEEEYVYPPGQIFRSVAVDEETVPGLAIIYLEEV